MTIGTVIVNQGKIETNLKLNLLELFENLGCAIPRFCYHARLEVAGNCRACLVEIENSPKPQASCAMPLRDGLSVFTESPLVFKAQEGVMEFLLLNHPLDCPICDQGGRCDLQDQAQYFGSDRSRVYEFRRGVEDKNWGPLIKTVMTRCIHCTRCVRFSGNVAGENNIGTINRSENTEISLFFQMKSSSEIFTNVIDLCPVGMCYSKTFCLSND
jgi:NADH dehydrogenase/NADH:ubiquinone oxidoreductase subunit G